MILKKALREEKGFTGVDLTIAVIILMLFVALITTLFYNVYLSSSSTKRSATANSYIIDVFENIDRMTYEEVQQDNIVNSSTDTFVQVLQAKLIENSKIDNVLIKRGITEDKNLAKPFQLEISVSNYNQTEGNTDKEDLIKIIKVRMKYKVGKKVETIDSQRLKTKEISYQDNLGITPKVTEGMTPVKWIATSETAGYWQATTTADPEWFEYRDKKWANVMLKDGLTLDNNGKVVTPGSMYVYIPRYAYQIPVSNYHTNTAGEISIKFLNKDNTCKDGTQTVVKNAINSTTAGSGINATTYYIQHPAFTYGNTELEGIWVSKFEPSNPNCTADVNSGNVSYDTISDKTIKSIPGVAPWANISVTQILDLTLNMNKAGNVYGLNTSDQKVDPHMMKRTEWAAIAYLTGSKYGNNEIANKSTVLTGNIVVNGTNYQYDTTQGQTTSSTGNIYGVYDVGNGVRTMYYASYLTEVTANTHVQKFNTLDEKYVDKYVGTAAEGQLENNLEMNKLKYGDSIYEICAKTGGYNSWNGGNSAYTSTTYPFFHSGGIFGYARNTGGAYTSFSFRVTINVI